MAGCDGTSSGYTSISFTTQSASVPLVVANRLTIGAPAMRTAVFNGSET